MSDRPQRLSGNNPLGDFADDQRMPRVWGHPIRLPAERSGSAGVRMSRLAPCSRCPLTRRPICWDSSRAKVTSRLATASPIGVEVSSGSVTEARIAPSASHPPAPARSPRGRGRTGRACKTQSRRSRRPGIARSRRVKVASSAGPRVGRVDVGIEPDRLPVTGLAVGDDSLVLRFDGELGQPFGLLEVVGSLGDAEPPVDPDVQGARLLPGPWGPGFPPTSVRLR